MRSCLSWGIHATSAPTDAVVATVGSISVESTQSFPPAVILHQFTAGPELPARLCFHPATEPSASATWAVGSRPIIVAREWLDYVRILCVNQGPRDHHQQQRLQEQHHASFHASFEWMRTPSCVPAATNQPTADTYAP